MHPPHFCLQKVLQIAYVNTSFCIRETAILCLALNFIHAINTMISHPFQVSITHSCMRFQSCQPAGNCLACDVTLPPPPPSHSTKKTNTHYFPQSSPKTSALLPTTPSTINIINRLSDFSLSWSHLFYRNLSNSNLIFTCEAIKHEAEKDLSEKKKARACATRIGQGIRLDQIGQANGQPA